MQYLRTYLHLPEEIVPATLKKAARPMPRNIPARGGERSYRSEDDRGSYRRTTGDKAGPGADFRPEFVRAGILSR